MNDKAQYARYQELVEHRLAEYFPGKGLDEAMRYSLLAGGKRVRPVLTLAFCEAAGGRAEQALEFACAIEMLHTYSLIHDDLPCMDDDDLRRGRPTCHVKFGETAAVLAGDALQAAAFQTVLGAEGFQRGETPLLAARVLAEAAGPEGMCLGQYWDTLGKDGPDSLDKLVEIDDKKTGDLLRAACLMGVIAAADCQENVSDGHIDAAMDYAANLGLAFQIRDDILDVTGTEEELGKPIGSDVAQEKTTYVTLAGLEECERAVERYTAAAREALLKAHWPGGTEFLLELAQELAGRTK